MHGSPCALPPPQRSWKPTLRWSLPRAHGIGEGTGPVGSFVTTADLIHPDRRCLPGSVTPPRHKVPHPGKAPTAVPALGQTRTLAAPSLTRVRENRDAPGPTALGLGYPGHHLLQRAAVEAHHHAPVRRARHAGLLEVLAAHRAHGSPAAGKADDAGWGGREGIPAPLPRGQACAPGGPPSLPTAPTAKQRAGAHQPARTSDATRLASYDAPWLQRRASLEARVRAAAAGTAETKRRGRNILNTCVPAPRSSTPRTVSLWEGVPTFTHLTADVRA